MPVIKAVDLAYGRLRSPDLDKQEEFLTAFGMVRADRTKNALYMRGTDAPHHIHVTELGAPKYVGIAFHAGSMDDLEKLSRAPGASSIESIDEPGGGNRVRLFEVGTNNPVTFNSTKVLYNRKTGKMDTEGVKSIRTN